jgi:GTP-binding protein EngB required for normal cell division
LDRTSIALILEQTIGFLNGPGGLLLGVPVREDFGRRTGALLDKAHFPGEVLYVGVLGGTGVGKSTLINALARAQISGVSDRRPFTDRAVVYRYRDTERGLGEVAHLIREPDALHDSEPIKDLVLIDLPDFDSTELENRTTVLHMLPWLDCVVWVVTPEKYADEVFYRLVRDTAINTENFTFVLNKTDELKVQDGAESHGKFTDVLGDFAFRLRHEAGIEQPRIFALSAVQEFRGATHDPILEKEFDRFRNFLMARRTAKEITSVKTVNLVEETSRLLAEIREAVRPEDLARLAQSIRGMEAEHSDVQPAVGLVVQEQREQLASAVFRLLIAEERSIRPVKLGMKMMDFRFRAESAPEGLLESHFQALADALGKETRRDLERREAQTEHELLLALGGTAASSGSDPRPLIDEVVRKASIAFTGGLSLMRSRRGGWFTRAWQKVVLALPFLVFAVKLASLVRIQAFLDQPNFGKAIGVALAVVTNLFSSDGLVGLCVVLICQLLLTWHLASKRLRKLEKRSQALADAAVDELRRSLVSATEEFRKRQLQTAEHIEEGINGLTALEQKFRTVSQSEPRLRHAAS